MQVWHSANTILQSEALWRKETDQLTQKLSLNINGVIPVPSKKACCHDEPPVHDFHPPEQRKVVGDGGRAQCGSCSSMRKGAGVVMSPNTSSAQATCETVSLSFTLPSSWRSAASEQLSQPEGLLFLWVWMAFFDWTTASETFSNICPTVFT